MTSTKKAKALAAVVIVAAAGVAAAAPASAATTSHGFVPKPGAASSAARAALTRTTPDTTKVTCTSAYDLAVCAQIIGSYTSDSMYMTTCYGGSGTAELHEEILSPDGSYWNTKDFKVKSEGCITGFELGPGYKTPGSWKFRGWREYSGGTYHDAQVTLGVTG